MCAIKRSIPKVDAMSNILGGHVYADDLAKKDALIIKIFRSPIAFGKIINIDVEEARNLEGVECVLTYKDVPQIRYTRAGQAFPEESPYDLYILDQIVRYVGDDVAIVAATTEEIALEALKLIKVEFEEYEPVLDFEKAIDHPSIIHPEDDIVVHSETHFFPERNIVSQVDIANGDMEKALAESDIVHTGTYYIQGCSQGMMETFRSNAYIDERDRLVVVSSTQIPFHNRRQIARSLGIPEVKVRVIKPRIGGGFGAKQNSNTEFYPAIVTWITKKPSKINFTREETFESGSPRHPMRVDVTVGMMKDGKMKAIDMHGLSDTGSAAEHGHAVFLQVGMKSLGMFNKCDAVSFKGDVVYTNHLTFGAYRGYGATQGDYALGSCITDICEQYGLDPVEVHLKNVVREGEFSVPFGFFGGPAPARGYALESCQLPYCIERGAELIGWKEKRNASREISPTKRRGLGMAVGRQGSGIPGVDMASAVLKLNNDGSFQLLIGATDLGTGSDTILTQICAEELTVPFEDIFVFSSDTDFTPYDCGAYASSTTYVSGNAIKKTATKMREELTREAAVILEVEEDDLFIENGTVKSKTTDKQITFQGIAHKLGCSCKQLLTTDSFTGKGSPVPYIAGFAEIEVDIETGKVDVIEYVGVCDVGTVINPTLARVQAEGGILQGIGMALWEDVVFDDKGKMLSNSFLKYPMPTRDNVGKITVDFAESYEPTGPFGAKSIGEVVLNASAPAIRAAILDATGVRLNSMPFTPSKILKGIMDLK